MPNVITFLRGNKKDIPKLKAGSPAFCLDSKELYVGDGTTNIKFLNESDVVRASDAEAIAGTNNVNLITPKNLKVAMDNKETTTKVSWDRVTGKPSTFPPSTHVHDLSTSTKDGFMSKADKSKLDGVANGANNYVHPSTHPASVIVQDANNRFATDTEKSNWNAKATTAVVTTTANGLMTKEDKSKLDGVANGAQVNQNAFSNVKVGTTTVSADSVTDTLEIVAGANITITSDATNDKITIASSGNNYVHPSTHPASIIAQDANNRFATDAEKNNWNAKATTAVVTTAANGLMTKEDKSKLDGVANGANNYTHPNVGTAGTYPKVTINAQGHVTSGASLAVADIPTLTASKISDFTTQVRTSALDQMAAPLNNVSVNNKRIINVANGSSNGDAVNLGQLNTVVNNAVSGVSNAIHAPVADLAACKAIVASRRMDKMLLNIETMGLYRWDAENKDADNDKTIIRPTDIATSVAGRWLKMNSSLNEHNALDNMQGGTTGEYYHLTNAQLTKLNGVATGANNYVHPSTHPASIIAQDANNRFATDTEKSNWNAKATTAVVTTTANGLMTKEDKVKLNGVATGANNYVHPSTHPASVIVQDANNRFATDTEKNNWNGKASTAVVSTTANGLMTKEDKVKLNGVATGAQVNQNAFSNVKVGSTTVAADSVTDTLEIVAGTNVTITPDATNDKITITSKDTVYTHPSTHPASVIVQDANNRFATDTEKSNWNAKATTAIVSTTANGLMTKEDKVKLNGVATGANNYVHPNVGTAGTYPKVTVNAQGHVTGGSGLAVTDIPNLTKSKITDFPSSLPANGGNADTVDGKHASEFILTSASCNKNWQWSGQSGQPTWVWGGNNDQNDMKVYNPANFNVNSSTYVQGRNLVAEVDSLKQSVGGKKCRISDNERHVLLNQQVTIAASTAYWVILGRWQATVTGSVRVKMNRTSGDRSIEVSRSDISMNCTERFTVGTVIPDHTDIKPYTISHEYKGVVGDMFVEDGKIYTFVMHGYSSTAPYGCNRLAIYYDLL